MCTYMYVHICIHTYVHIYIYTCICRVDFKDGPKALKDAETQASDEDSILSSSLFLLTMREVTSPQPRIV